MSTTNFVNGSTLSDDAWFNDVDAWTYQGVALGNINLGANFISRAGTNAGLSLDASNNATFSANLYINDTANTAMTLGLTINQGGADNEIFALKSSDVAHGITTPTETDTFCSMTKVIAGGGGLIFDVFQGGVASSRGLIVRSTNDTTDATRTTGGVGAIELRSSLKSGTDFASVGADKNLCVISDNGTTRFIFDSDGDSHQDVGTAWNNFDAHDDLRVMDAIAMTLNRDDPLRLAFVESLEDARDVLSRIPGKPIVTFNDDGHHFANMSRMTMLHHGAIRQIGRAQFEEREFVHGEIQRITARLNLLEHRT